MSISTETGVYRVAGTNIAVRATRWMNAIICFRSMCGDSQLA